MVAALIGPGRSDRAVTRGHSCSDPLRIPRVADADAPWLAGPRVAAGDDVARGVDAVVANAGGVEEADGGLHGPAFDEPRWIDHSVVAMSADVEIPATR